MNEIIQINEDNKVSARNLYKILGLASGQFTRWAKTNITENIFAENGADYDGFDISVEGNDVKDYALDIGFAKKICMTSHTTRGEQVRDYFIECENRLKTKMEALTPEQEMARGLVAAYKVLESTKLELAQTKQIVNELQPKASYYDLVLKSTSVISVSKIAKDYGKSAIWLNQALAERKIQYNQGGVWLLYQKYAEMGYTQSTTYMIDEEHSSLLTKWTQKGRLFIYDLLKQDNILPLIEQTKEVAINE